MRAWPVWCLVCFSQFKPKQQIIENVLHAYTCVVCVCMCVGSTEEEERLFQFSAADNATAAATELSAAATGLSAATASLSTAATGLSTAATSLSEAATAAAKLYATPDDRLSATKQATLYRERGDS